LWNHTPASPQHPSTVSRRALLKRGATAAALAPGARSLVAILGSARLEGDNRRAAFVLGGAQRWVIDTRQFAGRPRLRIRQTKDELCIELCNARFPGTPWPADFVATVGRGVFASSLRLQMALGGFDAVAPLERWLLGAAPLSSPLRGDIPPLQLGATAALRLRGAGRAVFSPSWALELQGHGIAAFDGLGGGMVSDTATLQLPASDAPSALADQPARRSLVAIERGERPWRMTVACADSRGQCLEYTGHPFDDILVETGETRSGTTRRALVTRSRSGQRNAESPDHPTVHYRLAGDLTTAAATSAVVPLRDLQYAIAFDPAGDQHVLLAGIHDRTWTYGDGFAVEIGDAPPGHAALEVQRQPGGPATTRFEPTLHRVALPLAGALSEPTVVTGNVRVAIDLEPDNGASGVQPTVDRARLYREPTSGRIALDLPNAPPLTAIRHTDLLSLRFEFVNLGLEAAGTAQARLVPTSAAKNSGAFINVFFPSQNFAEQAFYEAATDVSDSNSVSFASKDDHGNNLPGSSNPSGSETPAAAPIRVSAAAESRLSFRLPATVTQIAYTLPALLDWSQLEPSLVATALPPPPVVVILPIGPGQPAKPGGKTEVAQPRTPLAFDVRQPASTSVEIDATAQQQIAQTLAKHARRGTKPTPEHLQNIAGTLLQSPIGMASVDHARLDPTIPDILNPRPPAGTETAIQAPYRLIISPNHFNAWAHSPTAISASVGAKDIIAELWHTRLGVWNARDGAVDETQDYYRTIRAVWSPDYVASYKPTDQPPHYSTGMNSAGNPFRTSLDARDRHELVALTADHVITGSEDRYVRVNRMMLSSLGAWLDVRGGWPLDFPESKTYGLTVEEWRHRATMGRDHYVKVVYKGYLFPFGHPASLIKVTERKFYRPPNQSYQVAYLRQRFYVSVRQPLKQYPASGQPKSGRAMPFRTIELTTLTTPSLDKPEASAINGQGQDAFWLRVGGQDFLFHVVGTDAESRRFDFTTPLAFLSGRTAWDVATTQAAAASLDTGPAARRQRPGGGQKLALTPSRKTGDTTLQIDDITFSADTLSPVPGSLFGADQPAFYPKVAQASAEIEAVKQVVGATGGVPIKIADRYVDQGFTSGVTDPTKSNDGEVFAELVGTALPLTFGSGGASTDKVGALATPSMAISGLSRLSGPVSGPLDQMLLGNFDPSKFFGALDVKLLGGISLLDIVVQATGLGAQLDTLKSQLEQQLGTAQQQIAATALDALPKTQVPAFLAQTVYDIDATVAQLQAQKANAGKTADQLHAMAEALPADLKVPKQIQLVFKWDPKVQTSGPFVVIGDPTSTLSLTALLLVPLPTPGSAPPSPSYTVRAKLTNFAIDLFGIIRLDFDHVTVTKQAQGKPDIDAAITNIAFAGPLQFVQELQSVIPSNGLSPATLDVSPTGVQVGFALALPNIGVGAFTLMNVAMSAQLDLPFTGDPLRFRFHFCERDNPFTLTVYGLGGGGFFGIDLGLDGVELLELSIEFGAAVSIDLGVASGSVHIMAGIYMSLQTQSSGEAVTLTGYLRAGGSLTVIQLITVSVELYMSLTYQSSDNSVWGEASLTVDVEVMFFSQSVAVQMRREFKDPAPPGFAGLMTASEYGQYIAAFAA